MTRERLDSSISDTRPFATRTPGRYTLKFVAMSPDDELVAITRRYSEGIEKPAHVWIERLRDDDGFRASVRYGRCETHAEGTDARSALVEAFRAAQSALAEEPRPERATSDPRRIEP